MVFFIKRHTTILIYSLLFSFILFGVWSTSGFNYFSELLQFFGALCLSYIIINKLSNKVNLFVTNKVKSLQHLISSKHLFIFSSLLIVFHFIQLKGVPALEAMFMDNGDSVALVRANIAERNGTLFNYISSFLIHSILPFSILILFFEKKKLFYILLLCLAAFYAFALMQKSYILTIFLPIIVFSVLNKSIINFIICLSIVFTIIISLTYIANPELKKSVQHEKNKIVNHDLNNKKQKATPPGSFTRILIGLRNRVLITPGKMVSTWFDNIPKNLPYQGVDGYSIITKIKGIEHVDYGKEMYLLLKKDKAELKGTMNSASFMYDYAYFGRYGLILSGIILAFLFNIIENLFKNKFKLKIALNLYSILILSSSSITTLIFSGGWGLIIFLSFLFPFTLKQTTDPIT